MIPLLQSRDMAETGAWERERVAAEVAQAALAGEGFGVIDLDGGLVASVVSVDHPVRFRAAATVQHHGVNPFARPLRVHYGVAVRHVSILHADYLGRISLAERRALRMFCAALLAYPGATWLDLWRVSADSLFRRRLLAGLPEGPVRRWWHAFEELPAGQQAAQVEPMLERLSPLIHEPALYATLAHRRGFNFRGLLERRRAFLADLSGLPAREARFLAGLLVWRFYLASLVHTASAPYRLFLPAAALRAAGLDRAQAHAARRGLEMILEAEG
jgi:hypothetical protein